MISAKIICDSLSHAGVRLTTMELTYHRFIHSEFMTHRMFSRNASSSRAIPIVKMIKQVQENPAMPIYWGKNQPGMQAREECSNSITINEEYQSYTYNRESCWKEARSVMCEYAGGFMGAGYHKQIVNRLLEPFQGIKVIVTATEWDNFFKLRLHPDAQPEMRVLAEHMQKAMLDSKPVLLQPGEWHLPYAECKEILDNTDNAYDVIGRAIKCSVARCARVSYLNHDNSTPDVEKDIKLADMLLEAGHLSPLEHQGTPMDFSHVQEWYDLKGVTHQDVNAWHWSGNFRSWIQHRQLISAV